MFWDNLRTYTINQFKDFQSQDKDQNNKNVNIMIAKMRISIILEHRTKKCNQKKYLKKKE